MCKYFIFLLLISIFFLFVMQTESSGQSKVNNNLNAVIYTMPFNFLHVINSLLLMYYIVAQNGNFLVGIVLHESIFRGKLAI